MTRTRSAGRPTSSRRRRALCSEWATTASMRREDAVGGADLAAARPRRQDVVGGHHPRAQRRQQVGVEGRRGQPLVVDDVGVGVAAEAQHVRQVLGALEGEPPAGLQAAGGGAAVEALVDRVALGRRHRAVEEAGGDQLDLGAGAGQRRGERAVVGRRERRGVDELDFHRRCAASAGHRTGDYRGHLVARALLLRREHQRPRVPAGLPAGDRGDAPGRGRARDPRPRQRLERRLGRRGAGARRRRSS